MFYDYCRRLLVWMSPWSQTGQRYRDVFHFLKGQGHQRLPQRQQPFTGGGISTYPGFHSSNVVELLYNPNYSEFRSVKITLVGNARISKSRTTSIFNILFTEFLITCRLERRIKSMAIVFHGETLTSPDSIWKSKTKFSPFLADYCYKEYEHILDI